MYLIVQPACRPTPARSRASGSAPPAAQQRVVWPHYPLLPPRRDRPPLARRPDGPEFLHIDSRYTSLLFLRLNARKIVRPARRLTISTRRVVLPEPAPARTTRLRRVSARKAKIAFW